MILFSLQNVFSQNTFKTIIKDSSTNETLFGARASIKGTNNGALANADGEIILSKILNGKQIIRFSYVGYKTVEQEFEFPLRQQIEVVFYLQIPKIFWTKSSFKVHEATEVLQKFLHVWKF